MSTKSSDGDEVARLMQEQGLSRVQATKMLYEIVKQKKKEEAANSISLEASKIAPLLKHEGCSAVKKHIERYSSFKDVTLPVSAVHEDVDFSQSRPVLKIDTENRQTSENNTSPRNGDITANLKIQEEPQNNKQKTEIYESEEVAVPFCEDKSSESMPAQPEDPIPEFDLSPAGSTMSANAVRRRSSNSSLNLRPLARLHPHKFSKDGLSAGDSEEDDDVPHEQLDYQSGDSSDGEVWEEPTPYPLAAASPAASAARTMSGAAAGLRLPPPINTNTSPSSSQPIRAAALPTESATPIATHPSPTLPSPVLTKRQPLPTDSQDPGIDLTFSSSNDSRERTESQQRAVPSSVANSSSATLESKASMSQPVAPVQAAPSRMQAPRPISPVPPLGLSEKNALLQSCRTPMSRSSNAELTSPTAASVASSASYSSTATLQSTQTASRAAEVMNVKVGSKKLTVRAVGSGPAVRAPVAPVAATVATEAGSPPSYAGNSSPPAYDPSVTPSKLSASTLPLPPPPAYSSPETHHAPPAAAKPASSAASALFEQVPDAAATPLSPKSVLKRPSIPMTSPSIAQSSHHSTASIASSVSSTESLSVHKETHRQSITSSVEAHALSDVDEGDEEEDGLTSEERVAKMMAKYRRRSHMKKDALPAAFQNLSPIDEKEIERLMKQDQAEREATAIAKSLKAGGSTHTSASASSHSILSQEGELVVPEKREVAAVMTKESTDLVEELVSQGYSRENALNLAKEIELDRRGERYRPRRITPYQHELTFPQMRGPPRSGASVSSMRSYDRFNNDDDAGSVISNISGVSKASSFCESDKLLMNLLLSQQKGKYGTNMYESLTNDDEPAIERFMSQGCTLDQAVLQVFERKYGSVDNQVLPKSVYSNSNGSALNSSTKAGQMIGEDALEIVDAMHAEIELLMLSGGYSREVAVKMLLSKVAKERAMQERQTAAGIMPPPTNRSHHQFHRASSMSAMPASRELEPQKMPTPAVHHASQPHAHTLHSARSMHAMPSSGASLDGRSVNSSGTAGRSSRSRSEMVPPPDAPTHPGSHHSSHRGISRHHSTANMYDSSNRRRPSGSGMSVNSASGIASVASAKTTTSAGSRTDDRDFLSSLLREQEAAYGVNMYDYLSPEDLEVNRLMAEFGFSKTDAMIAVFQQFPPQTVPPSARSVGGHPGRGGSGASVSSSSSGRPLPMHPPAAPPSSRHAAPKPAPAPSASAYNEEEELERVMRLSMLEVQNRPGAVVVPGTGASSSRPGAPVSASAGPAVGGGSYAQQRAASTHDINALVQMGFSVAQAQEALARHNHDLQKAIDYLLGGA